ncbi:hypothetical protein [Arenimonas sp.]|jgi:hypothetical protein|uniref:hypothetical protein n=1 Tax=Arenimonas sp. TaxID=1872635 RepID=UPI0037BFAB55
MTDHHGNPLTTDPTLTAEQWLDYGLSRGWCSTSFCSTHDLGPITADEESALDDGDDPCMPVVRLL